jgi:cytochrome subunit of sulfide dehydrogenase
MKRGHVLGPLCAAALLAAGVPAAADAQESAYARSLAATCFTCHGTDGRSVGGTPPSIAGQDRSYLLQQMREFRDGRRPATIMHQHAKGYTDEQLELIATYFSKVAPGPAAPAPAAAPPARGEY